MSITLKNVTVNLQDANRKQDKEEATTSKKKRNRIDFLAKQHDKSDLRVLDHLAKLLSGRNECVAVCVINKTMYIAANEFHTKTKPSTLGYKEISELATFLQHFRSNYSRR